MGDTAEELKSLREEVAALRKELAELRADRSVHHYHHQAAPIHYAIPLYDPNHAPAPSYTPSWRVTCAAPTIGNGQAMGGMAGYAWNGDGGTEV